MSDIFTPEYFEKHVTTVVPIVNVDLLIRDKEGRILLSWRDDGMFKGWHVPGRIIRFKESLEEAIIKCWDLEIGGVCSWNTPIFNFIEFFETIRHVETRGHFITFLYGTNDFEFTQNDASENYELTKNKDKSRLVYDSIERIWVDDIKWFNKCPEDLIPEQDRYREYFKQ